MNAITLERTPLRTAPGDTVLETIAPNTKLVVEELTTQPSWYHVSMVDTRLVNGWVNRRSVKVDTKPAPPPTPPPPPVPPMEPVHVIKVNPVGKVSLDGLPYE